MARRKKKKSILAGEFGAWVSLILPLAMLGLWLAVSKKNRLPQ